MQELDEPVLHAILSSIDEGIHVVDRQGITIFFNPTAARLEGVEAREVVGHHILEIYPSLTPSTSTLLQVINDGQPIVNRQQSYTNFKGDRIVTINTTLPLIVDGELIGAIEISKDITQIKRLSEQVVDLQAELYGQKKAPLPLRAAGAPPYTLDDIVGGSPPILGLKHTILRAARSSSPVLVWGETGTGKELVVQAIHNASSRRNGPFIAQNCAALPETLLEGILFGTVKGGFTGAEDRPGLFELAHEGTLYLDEINSMPLQLQGKLLRVLQDGNIRRVGDIRVRAVNVRVVASSNIDPLEAVGRHQLREDLYYRLNVLSLEVPPLRLRRDDIPLLVNHFIKKYNQKLGLDVTGISPRTLEAFLDYDWPGNVRELEHAIEGAMNILDGAEIGYEHLQRPIRTPERPGRGAGIGRTPGDRAPLRSVLADAERALLEQALAGANGNISRAARALGIPRQTLQYRLKMHGLRRQE